MLGFFPTLQVRPGILFTVSAEVAAMALKCASLAFTAVPRQGTWTLKVRLVARQLPFGARLLHWQVVGLVDGQKLGGGGYLFAITDRRTDVCRHRQLT